MSDPVTVAGVTVDPGVRRDIAPTASESFLGDRTSLPITVVNGSEPGPRVFVTAALHGDELNGIAVCRSLLATLRPETLRGCVVVVPIVNVPGVQIGSRYLPDRRDLNRSFPGSRTGSTASRIARLLLDEVVLDSDYGVDLHTAANHRTNAPQIRITPGDGTALDLAQAFGAPFVLDAPLRAGSLRAAAAEHGVPVLTYEGGGPSRFDDDAIDVASRGVLRVLQRLGMVGSAPEPRTAAPMVLHASRWVRAPHGGIVELQVGSGDRVEIGQPLWLTTSPLGHARSAVDADEPGWVIGVTTLPLVQPGHAVIHLGLPGNRPPSEDDPTEEEDLDPELIEDL